MRGSRFRRFEVAGSQGLSLSGFRAAVTNRWFHPPTQPTQTFFANYVRVLGNGSQTLTVQWATNAQNLSAPLAVFVRASDGRMFIQARHAQVRAPQAVTGYQQLTIDGKPQMPGKIGAEAFEWAFPVVEVSRPKPGENATANGSSTPVVNGKVGFMQPAGTQATASCTWKFGEGSAVPDPPPTVAAQATPTPGSAGDFFKYIQLRERCYSRY